MEITKDIIFVGVNDHDVDLFEGHYIVPEGMAYNSYLINDDKVAAEKLAAAEALRDELKEKKITIPVKTGDNGKIFGSVSSKEIAEVIKEQLGIEVDKKKIIVKDPIKSLGGYQIQIKLHPQVTGEVLLDVVEK